MSDLYLINNLTNIDPLQDIKDQFDNSNANLQSQLTINSDSISTINNTLTGYGNSISTINNTLTGYGNSFTSSNLIINSSNNYINMKTLNNSNNNQSLFTHQNSGNSFTLNFQRQYDTLNNQPNYIFSVGSNADKNLLIDALKISNNGNLEIYRDLKLGQYNDVEQTILNIQGDISDIQEDLKGNGYDIAKEIRDWASFGMNTALVGTLSSYFGSSLFGDKIKDAFVDDIADAFDRDNFEGETQEEEDENRDKGKQLLRLEDIYARPFAIVSSRLYNTNPFYYTNIGVQRYDTGFYGNVLMTKNTKISVNDNISYSNDNTKYANNGSSNNDIIVLRDTLSGVQKEYYGDYLFLGYSNLDPIGTITPSNDYTYRLRVNGSVNIETQLFINDFNILSNDAITNSNLLQNVYSQNYLIHSSNPYLESKTLDNTIDKQDVFRFRNSGNSYTLRLRRDLVGTTSTAQPNYVWSIGSNATISSLNDFMIWHNNGKVEFNTETQFDGIATIYGNRHGINGVETNKSVYQIKINQSSSNAKTAFSFEPNANFSYSEIRMNSNNIINIGSNLWNLDLTLQDLNNRLQTQQNLIDSNSINSIDSNFSVILETDTITPITTFTFGSLSNSCLKNLSLNNNNIVGVNSLSTEFIILGSNNIDVETQINSLTTKTINLDSNGKIDYSHILNPPAVYNSNVYLDSGIEFIPATSTYIDFKNITGDYNQRILGNSNGLTLFGGFGTSNICLNTNGTTTLFNSFTGTNGSLSNLTLNSNLLTTNSFTLSNTQSSNTFINYFNGFLNFPIGFESRGAIFVNNSNVLYTNNIITRGGDNTPTNYMKISNNQFFHMTGSLTSNLFGSIINDNGSEQLQLVSGNGLSCLSGDLMRFKSDRIIFQDTNGFDIISWEKTLNRVLFIEDLVCDSGLFAKTGLYTNFIVPDNSNQMKICDSNFNPYMIFDYTNNLIRYEKNIQFITADIICNYPLQFKTSDLQNQITVNPYFNRVENVKQINSSDNTFLIRNSNGDNLLQIQSDSTFTRFVRILSSSSQTFTTTNITNILQASPGLLQSPNGNIISYSGTNRNFQFLQIGYYNISVNLQIENDEVNDQAIIIRLYNGNSIAKEIIQQMRADDASFRGMRNVDFNIIHQVITGQLTNNWNIQTESMVGSYKVRDYTINIIKL